MDEYRDWADDVAGVLGILGYDDVEVTPSNVTLSPYYYVNVYFDVPGKNLYGIISQEREYEDTDDLLVGVYQGECMEESIDDTPVSVPNLARAVYELERLRREAILGW